MFLLTGLTTISATRVEPTTNLKTNSTADLTVYYMLGIAFIANATVTAYNKDTNESYDVEVRDPQWFPFEYCVEGIPTGEYTITATHDLYGTQSKDVYIHEGDNTVVIRRFFNFNACAAAQLTIKT